MFLFYFKKMLQNFIEHVWPPFSFLLSDWLIIRQGLSIYLLLRYVPCNCGLGIFSTEHETHRSWDKGDIFQIHTNLHSGLSIYCYLLTKLLSPLIHENTKSNLFVQSELAGAIHKSDCFIFPRMDQ